MTQTIEKTKDLVSLLKKRRIDLGISQVDLARLCNLSNNGISKMEIAQSEVKVSTLLKMSKVLGLKIKIEFEE